MVRSWHSRKHISLMNSVDGHQQVDSLNIQKQIYFLWMLDYTAFVMKTDWIHLKVFQYDILYCILFYSLIEVLRYLRWDGLLSTLWDEFCVHHSTTNCFLQFLEAQIWRICYYYNSCYLAHLKFGINNSNQPTRNHEWIYLFIWINWRLNVIFVLIHYTFM